MISKWESRGIYEHPALHQKGTFGKVALLETDVYVLKIDSVIMSCPQIWALKIHYKETIKKQKYKKVKV